MDRWIALHEGATGPKLRLFASLAGCDESTALGVLCHIWIWGVRENVTSSGLMKNTSKEHIKNIFAYTIPKELDPQSVVDALIESEWIDEIEGAYYIHDWSEHQKPWAQYKAKTEAETERKRKQRLKKKLLSKLSDTRPTDEPEVSPPKGDVEPPGEEPVGDPTKPPTNPSGQKYTPAFEQFWAVYPRKDEKANAYKKYRARLNDGFSEDEMLIAAAAYAAQCKRLQTEKCYIKLGKTFLSETTPFIDFLPKGENLAGPPGGVPEYDPGDLNGSLKKIAQAITKWSVVSKMSRPTRCMKLFESQARPWIKSMNWPAPSTGSMRYCGSPRMASRQTPEGTSPAPNWQENSAAETVNTSKWLISWKEKVKMRRKDRLYNGKSKAYNSLAIAFPPKKFTGG